MPGALEYHSRVISGRELVPSKFNWGTYIWNVSCALFRREALRFVDWERVCAMRFCGDWLFYVMVLRQGALAAEPQHLARFRSHAATVSQSGEAVFLRYEEGLEVLRYMLEHYSFGWFAQAHTAFMWQWALRHAALPEKEKAVFRSRLKELLGGKSVLARWAAGLLAPIAAWLRRA